MSKLQILPILLIIILLIILSISTVMELTSSTSYTDIITFLHEDQTSEREYDIVSYNCHNFTVDTRKNASLKGIDSAYVLLRNGRYHAIVAFNTSDKGLVAFNPQTDAPKNYEVGGLYKDWVITEIQVYWQEIDSVDTLYSIEDYISVQKI